MFEEFGKNNSHLLSDDDRYFNRQLAHYCAALKAFRTFPTDSTTLHLPEGLGTLSVPLHPWQYFYHNQSYFIEHTKFSQEIAYTALLEDAVQDTRTKLDRLAGVQMYESCVENGQIITDAGRARELVARCSDHTWNGILEFHIGERHFVADVNAAIWAMPATLFHTVRRPNCIEIMGRVGFRIIDAKCIYLIEL